MVLVVSNAIGIIELSSIASGYLVQDSMLKAADVQLLLARTICSGKYLVIVGGSVSSVNAAVEAGILAGRGFVIDSVNIPNIDDQVLSAFTGNIVADDHSRALGVVETFSATPIIQAADSAVKAASVTLLRVHVSMAIGGKGFFLVSGDVSAVTAAIEAASETVKESGMLVNRVVIPSASIEIFKEYY